MIQILFSFLFFSFMTQAQSVKSGMLQTESSIEVNGISLPSSKEEECLSASEAKDLKKTLTKELEKNGCSSTKWKVKGSKVDISLKCSKSGLEAKGNLQGQVKSKDYSLKGEAEGEFKGIPSTATIALQGKWLKPCP